MAGEQICGRILGSPILPKILSIVRVHDPDDAERACR